MEKWDGRDSTVAVWQSTTADVVLAEYEKWNGNRDDNVRRLNRGFRRNQCPFQPETGLSGNANITLHDRWKWKEQNNMIIMKSYIKTAGRKYQIEVYDQARAVEI